MQIVNYNGVYGEIRDGVINKIEELIEEYKKIVEDTYSDDIRIVYEDAISDLQEILYKSNDK